ncbi:opioid growth factor receptor-like protein 1 isoform X2 [Brienomyrus brachyistius]|nr:opioid growth factor receptor-like protein 1 isoform X2 [Brienomyrus brachyistius]
MEYFIFSIRNKQKRQELLEFAFQHYQPREEFVWCPSRIQRRFKQKEDQKRYAEGKHPCQRADCSPHMSERYPAVVAAPMKKCMETSGPSQTDIVDKERETDNYHVESADNATKTAAKELTDKELNIQETEQTAKKTDEPISPVKQVGQGLNKPINLIENSMDLNNDVTNRSKTDAVSRETVCENTESPKVVGDQVVCHTNLNDDLESQGLTVEVSKTHIILNEQLGSGNVHEEMTWSHVTPATEKRSFSAPADQEGSKSSLGENGIPNALSDTVEGHSSLSKDGIPRALNEKAESHSYPGIDEIPGSLSEKVAIHSSLSEDAIHRVEKVESHCSLGKDRIPCDLNEEAECQSVGYSMEPKTE